MGKTTGLAVALAAALGCDVGTAQAGPDVLGALAGVRTPASAAAPAADPAWFGVAVRAANTAEFRSEVLSVEPGSPAEAAGLRPGDQLASVQKAPRTLLSPNVLLPDQAALDKWLAAQRPGATFELTYVRGAHLVKAPLTLAAAPPSHRLTTAYDQLCKPGAEVAGAQACAALKADAARARAPAAPADLADAYAQLCKPGALQVSAATCAAMKADAAKPAQTAQTAQAAQTAKTAKTAQPAPTGKLASAVLPGPAAAPAPKPAADPKAKDLADTYAQLCKPGAMQVSTETCAAMKADAARK